ncbi:neocarzinostatin apoprotein domain-containing protein [Iamia majanohamensis]|uniref:Neocarzinostatin apoprotein domain-containing protein n=1 Tax=Iamia majanohamensis TaxID=467976 RepID=A0AAE9YAG5_9ACTN|nr:neocarzinostatin apoprotein domain-containing protein [Iamia majanohamensis]WCO65402.1 neocarzinostatin apoprotein domain-containing protein [Iamia majanohamensis]
MVRRTILALVAVLALVLASGACDRPAGSGLDIRAVGPTSGLEPGDLVEVRISGADPGQTLYLYQCAGGPTRSGCRADGRMAVVAGPGGAATAHWRAQGTAYASPYDGFNDMTEGCRPDRCSLNVTARIEDLNGTGPQPPPLALRFAGDRATFSATPTRDLTGGQRISVTGRAPGAEGRRVRIARALDSTSRNERYIQKVGGSVYVTVGRDGTFRGTFTLPAGVAGDPTAGCSEGFNLSCVLTAWVVKADGSAIDTSFGRPLVALDYRR